MSKLFIVFVVLFGLVGCNSRSKDFSAGCQFGAAAGLGMLGLPVEPAQFKKPCDESAKAYLAGKYDKVLAAPSPEPSVSPSPAPSASPESK